MRMTMRMRLHLAAFVLMAASVPLLAACGGDEAAEAADNAIAVEAIMGDPAAGEYTIVAKPASVKAGTVAFNIENKGEIEHEFEVIKTDVAAGDLPVAQGKADAEAQGGVEVDEIEDMGAGAEAQLVVELEKGNYLLLCNLPGHYEQGMVKAFKVK